jgi:hypothetical protein
VAGFLATVRAETAALDVSRRALRRFGLAVGGVFLALVAVSAWRHGGALGPVARGLLGAGGLLVVLGAAAPGALLPVYRVWMTAALAMGFAMTRVILTVAFVFVFVPVGLVFRLVRRDPLHQRPDPSAPSYWIRRTDGPSGKERLERMY